jgi:hypothetical protein
MSLEFDEEEKEPTKGTNSGHDEAPPLLVLWFPEETNLGEDVGEPS